MEALSLLPLSLHLKPLAFFEDSNSKEAPTLTISKATGIEMLAILRDLQLSVHVGINNLIIESNSMIMVKELQQLEPSMSLLGNVIKDAKELMARFSSWEVRYVGRICNEVEHRLSRLAWNINGISLWWGSFPDIISQVLWTERQLYG